MLALRGISLAVPEGAVVAVLGANGAGKTTTLRSVSGTVKRSGEILLDGKPLRGGPEASAKAGVAHVPEGRGTFTELSVTENLRLGAYTRRTRSLKADIERMATYFPWINERGEQRAGTLSGGEQQMLALARALMGRPRLLMLDEPSLGLAPLIVKEIFRIVRELNEKEGLTVLVVEQDARIALNAASTAYVLEVGKVAVSGSSADLRDDEAIRRSYLGTDGAVLPTGRLGPRLRRHLRVARARARADPPCHRRRQLRPGRDGDVLHLHRLDADDEPRRRLLARVRDHAARVVRRWLSGSIRR